MSIREKRSGTSRPAPGRETVYLTGRDRIENRKPGKGVLRGDRERGFTMVELLVVMVVISILAALTVPSSLAYIDQKRKEQCCLCQKAVLAYYHTATVDLGSWLTLEDYLEDLNGTEESLKGKIADSFSKKVYSETLKDSNSYIIYENNLAAARKQKCPSGGSYRAPSTKTVKCSVHGSL
ncbi:MAG: prepilin-type N-terminal cleavage/methylation domain-containing protein [Eubacteriales bacterium]|nr:prepilin-type N-terminal cleavage/methylation domain-containing protein [Eubacteriales bacterium]